MYTKIWMVMVLQSLSSNNEYSHTNVQRNAEANEENLSKMHQVEIIKS